MPRQKTVATYPDGSQLIRMRRPAEWSEYDRTHCEVCDREIASLYAIMGPEHQASGWRSYCAKHARERMPAEYVATEAAR